MEDIKIGQAYLFHGRMIYLGEVVRFDLLDVTIKKASWMGWMGVRFGELMETGPTEDTEIEVFPRELEVTIPRGSFARFPWGFDLPEQSI